MKIAIIDLGTNTCNLLIAAIKNGRWEEIHRSKEPVKLGRDGIHKQLLTPSAFQRGLTALKNHLEKINRYDVDEIHAYATSAVRSASNGNKFVELIKSELNITLEVIDGNQEAEFIFNGVLQGINLGLERFLVLDIGGGSNEFILAQDRKILWKQSFEIGMARVLERFSPDDPVTSHQIASMERWFEVELKDLWLAIDHNPIATLVGCSGAFDTFADLIEKVNPETRIRKSSEVTLEDFIQIYKQLLVSNKEDRIQMKGMDPMRVEMIVISSVFVNFIVNKLGIKRIIQTDYSLKEGALARFLK